MVNGASPGPAPAFQTRASNSRLTRSSWRTWPHLKLRRKVPRVEGALAVKPSTRAVPPARSASASSMQSPPVGVQRGGHQRHHLVAGVGSACCMAQVQVPVNQLGQAKAQGEGGGKNQPGIGHQATGGDRRRRCGCGRVGGPGSIYWEVCSFLRDRFAVSTARAGIPDSEEHSFRRVTSGR